MISFLVCGFARSGTTHLSKWLNSHAEIQLYNPSLPEPKFFSRLENFKQGRDWYEDSYFRDHENFIAGEKSTEYSESKEFVDRLTKTYPEMKLIFMVRNPIDRLISNFNWSKKNGFEKRSINKALEEEWNAGVEINGSIDTIQTRPFCYLGRSIYSRILKRVFDELPKNQILLIDFNNYVEAQLSTLTSIGEFLGFEPSIQNHSNTGHADRKTLGEVKDIDQKFIDYLMKDYHLVKSRYELI